MWYILNCKLWIVIVNKNSPVATAEKDSLFPFFCSNLRFLSKLHLDHVFHQFIGFFALSHKKLLLIDCTNLFHLQCRPGLPGPHLAPVASWLALASTVTLKVMGWDYSCGAAPGAPDLQGQESVSLPAEQHAAPGSARVSLLWATLPGDGKERTLPAA